MSDCVHKRVAEMLRADWTKHLLRFDINPLMLPDSELYHLVFKNVRNIDSDISGLRLTDDGLKLLRNRFENWTIPMEEGFVPKPIHLLFFDRNCTMPWFLNASVLILFEKQLAMRAKLVGDIDQLLTAFS